MLKLTLKDICCKYCRTPARIFLCEKSGCEKSVRWKPWVYAYAIKRSTWRHQTLKWKEIGYFFQYTALSNVVTFLESTEINWPWRVKKSPNQVSPSLFFSHLQNVTNQIYIILLFSIKILKYIAWWRLQNHGKKEETWFGEQHLSFKW